MDKFKKYFKPRIYIYEIEDVLLSSSDNTQLSVRSRASKNYNKVLAYNFILRKKDKGKDFLRIKKLPNRVFLCEVRQQKLEYAIYIAESDFTKDWNVYAKIPQLTFLRRLFKQQSNGVFKYKFPLLWNAINNSQNKKSVYITEHYAQNENEDYYIAHDFSDFDYKTLVTEGELTKRNKYMLKSYIIEFTNVYKEMLKFAGSKDFKTLLRQIKNGTIENEAVAYLGLAKFAIFSFKIITMFTNGGNASNSNEDSLIDLFFGGMDNFEVENFNFLDLTQQDVDMLNDGKFDNLISQWEDSSLVQNDSAAISFTGNSANTGNIFDDRGLDVLNEAREKGIDLKSSYERAPDGGIMNKDKYDIEQAIKQGLKDGKISQQKCDYLLDKLLKS